MLGELNWIFTAITDTIAWNTLPRGNRFELNISLLMQNESINYENKMFYRFVSKII